MPMVRQPLNVEHALLGLVRNHPLHGYEIHQRLCARHGLGRVWQIKQGLLYATLNRLEAEGLLAAELEPQGARPPRKLWQLTPDGVQVFTDWLKQPISHGRDFRIEFLAKLFFACQDGVTTAQTLIDVQRVATTDLLSALKAAAATLEAARSYDWLVLRYRVGQLEAALAWLDECVKPENRQPEAYETEQQTTIAGMQLARKSLPGAVVGRLRRPRRNAERPRAGGYARGRSGRLRRRFAH